MTLDAGSAPGPTRTTVHLVASLGGHMALLAALSSSLTSYRRVWVTSEGAYAKSLQERGETVRTLPRLDRSTFSLKAAAASAALAVRERPRIILTSGAGLTIPFCVAGRARGASIIFTETMARVGAPSTSARAAARLGADMFVQWPDLVPLLPGAVLCRPLLLEGAGRLATTATRDTGTFVTLGSHDQPFRRLANLVEAAADAGLLPRPIVVQDGTVSQAPRWADAHHAYVSPEAFRARVGRSAIVITHAGAGAMGVCLELGHRPIVVPRRRSFAEHVDDHQFDLAIKLESLGLILRGDEGFTVELIEQARSPLRVDRPPGDGVPMKGAVAAAVAVASRQRYGFIRGVRTRLRECA